MHCFSASDFLPKNNERTDKVLVMWKLWTQCYWCKGSESCIMQPLVFQSARKKKAAKLKPWAQTVHSFLFGQQTVCWWSKLFQTGLPTQVIIFSAWSVYNIWQSVVPCCYLFLLDLCVLTVFERTTLCEVSGEDYMWQIWRENQEKTNRQLNAWEMSQRSDRRR